MFIGNLHSNATEEAIDKLFSLRSARFLKQNCLVNMPVINETGENKGLAFIVTLEKVHQVNYLANRILQVGLKCRYHGVESITISSALVRNDNNLNKLIWGVNISLKHLCKVLRF